MTHLSLRRLQFLQSLVQVGILPLELPPALFLEALPALLLEALSAAIKKQCLETINS